MSALLEEKAADPSKAGGVAASHRRRTAWLVVYVSVLAAVCVLSVVLGTKNIGLGTVWDAFFHFTDTDDQAIVRACACRVRCWDSSPEWPSASPGR